MTVRQGDYFCFVFKPVITAVVIGATATRSINFTGCFTFTGPAADNNNRCFHMPSRSILFVSNAVHSIPLFAVDWSQSSRCLELYVRFWHRSFPVFWAVSYAVSQSDLDPSRLRFQPIMMVGSEMWIRVGNLLV